MTEWCRDMNTSVPFYMFHRQWTHNSLQFALSAKSCISMMQLSFLWLNDAETWSLLCLSICSIDNEPIIHCSLHFLQNHVYQWCTWAFYDWMMPRHEHFWAFLYVPGLLWFISNFSLICTNSTTQTIQALKDSSGKCSYSMLSMPKKKRCRMYCETDILWSNIKNKIKKFIQVLKIIWLSNECFCLNTQRGQIFIIHPEECTLKGLSMFWSKKKKKMKKECFQRNYKCSVILLI